MKKLLLALALSVHQLSAFACIISPFARTIHNADQLLLNSDIFFFGQFDSGAIDAERREQIAKFSVIKSYKGNVSGEILIANSLTTSCSRLFKSSMSPYYVFAEFNEGSSTYRIDGGATFVPLEYLLEDNWLPIP